MGKIEERLKELGLSLPPAPSPMGSYLPWTRVGNIVFISGQLPRRGNELVYKGKISSQLSIEQGIEASKLCALNAISVLKSAIVELDKVEQILRLTCWVASDPDFFDQPKIANGASDLLVEVFGERGKHSRMTTGVIALPANAPVAVDLVVAVE